MFDFVSGYICGMIITFLTIMFFMGANSDIKGGVKCQTRN